METASGGDCIGAIDSSGGYLQVHDIYTIVEGMEMGGVSKNQIKEPFLFSIMGQKKKISFLISSQIDEQARYLSS